MGYFSNGSEGCDYEARYCDHCIHNLEKYGCPCLDIHMLYNYDECNNDGSILHKMIPINDDGFNEQCIFYREKEV